MAKALFGAGCFWGVEEAFKSCKGVFKTCVGYAGGSVPNPTYHQVCSGETGHAEVVQVEYDPEQISYDELLRLFWSIHDPTTKDRQGPDIGSNYRSIIFVFDTQQEGLARASLEHERHKHRRPIVTEIVPAAPFYPAEEYHQCYLQKRKFGVRQPPH